MQDKSSMANEVIAPIYPACLWKPFYFLALMDICAHFPHHFYGSVQPPVGNGYHPQPTFPA